MKTLLAYELKKLLNRKILWVALALGMALLVWLDMSIINNTSYAQGWHDVYAKYEGQVATEALQQRMQEDFSSYVAAHPGDFQEAWRDDQTGAVHYMANDSGYNYGISDAYNWLSQGMTVESVEAQYLDAKQQLENGVSQDGTPLGYNDIRFYEKIVRNGLRTPIIHDALFWLEVFYQARGISTGILTLAVAVLALLGLFNGEASARMEAVVLSARYRQRLASAKLVSGGIVVIVFTMFYLALHIGLSILVYGLTGMDAPAQTVFSAMDTTALTAGTVGFLILLVKALAIMACASAVAWASARFRNPLMSLLAAAAVLAVTMLVMVVSAIPDYYNSPVLTAILEHAALLPLKVTLDDVLYEVARPPQLTCLLVFPVVFTALFCWLAKRAFLRRRRA